MRGRLPKNKTVLDFIKMGIIKRQLTRKEAKEITKNVMESGIIDADLRFRLAIVKAIEITGNV